MSPLPFCCLFKVKYFFNNIDYFFGIFIFRSFLFIKPIKASLIWFTICSFFRLIGFKNIFCQKWRIHRFWYLKYSLNILLFMFFFSSFAILLQKFGCNLDEDFLVCSFVCLGVSNIGSGAVSSVWILSGFFVGSYQELFLLH